jgi:hypothetical protein
VFFLLSRLPLRCLAEIALGLDMVVRYTRSVKFEESLKLYRELEG